MGNVTVSVSLPPSLLAEMDAAARRETLSRSAWLSRAVRLYLQERRQWNDLFALGDKQTRELGLTEADIEEAIRAVRREKAL